MDFGCKDSRLPDKIGPLSFNFLGHAPAEWVVKVFGRSLSRQRYAYKLPMNVVLEFVATFFSIDCRNTTVRPPLNTPPSILQDPATGRYGPSIVIGASYR